MNLKGEIKEKALQMAVKWNADQFDLINNAFFGHLAEFDGRIFADKAVTPTKSDIEYRAISYWGQVGSHHDTVSGSLKVTIVMFRTVQYCKLKLLTKSALQWMIWWIVFQLWVHKLFVEHHVWHLYTNHISYNSSSLRSNLYKLYDLLILSLIGNGHFWNSSQELKFLNKFRYKIWLKTAEKW